MNVPNYTAEILIKILLQSLEDRCGVKIEPKTKGTLIIKILSIICSLELSDGQLVNDEYIEKFNKKLSNKRKSIKC